MSRSTVAAVLAALITTPAVVAAQTQPPRDTTPTPVDSARRARPRRDSVATLEGVQVTARRSSRDATPVPALQALTLQPTVSITAAQAATTVNAVDPQDVVKYLPSVFVRKRNYGDPQATLATRVWGPSSGARSLIFADGVLLSALFANNNTIGGPRWNMVAPTEIARVDMMYGPFSAAYAGNSIGAVVEITTRLPDRLEGTVSQTLAYQHFDQYGTRATYPTSQTQGAVGDRFGRFSFWLAGDYLHSRAQPLLFVTRAGAPGAATPAGTAGGIGDTDRTGAPVTFVGASAIPRNDMATGKLKLAYDLTPAWRAAYTLGAWDNRTDAGVNTYLDATAGGADTYAGQAGFASGTYAQREVHTMHTLSLRTTPPDPGAAANGRGDAPRAWDGELVATRYRFNSSRQRSPLAAPASGTTFGPAGRVAVYDGTGWSTLDLKGAYRVGAVDSVPAGGSAAGRAARHTLGAGLHFDQYALLNPTYNTADWRDADAAFGTLASEGSGRTRTLAAWVQDAWQIAAPLKLTVGGRLERWRAFDGVNASTNASGLTRVVQPGRSLQRFSPKGVLAWTPDRDWTVTGSVGKAYRFATATELYQLVTTGPTFTSPAPDLRPDNVLATELRAERRFMTGGGPGFAQLAVFGQDVRDPILGSQYVPLVAGAATLYSVTQNADYTRARGAELAFGVRPAAALELTGSATYLDARVYAANAVGTATSAPGSTQGKFLPNVPKWRASFTATVRPTDPLALSVAGRYSTKVYSTLDNSETLFNRYFAFAEWFVADARATYRLGGSGFTAAAGVDNLFDRKYFLFHPFPQRTVVASLQYGL